MATVSVRASGFSQLVRAGGPSRLSDHPISEGCSSPFIVGICGRSWGTAPGVSEFDIIQAFYDLSSDEGPLMDDRVSVPAWEAVQGEVLAWLVRPS